MSITALAASFESGSSVLYTLQEPFSGILNEEARKSPAGFHNAEVSKSQEKVSFGFLTRHVPALILTAHTLDQHYMAVMLSSNGTKSYVTLKLGEQSSFAHFHVVPNLHQAQKRAIVCILSYFRHSHYLISLTRKEQPENIIRFCGKSFRFGGT